MRSFSLGVGSYIVLMGVFWFAVRALGVTQRLRGHELGPLLAAGLILGALWLFGWGAADGLARRGSAGRRGRRGACAPVYGIVRVLIPGIFCEAVYLLMAVPLRAVSSVDAMAYCALPVTLAGVFEFWRPEAQFAWQDLLVLAGLALPIEYGWLRVPPGTGLAGLPKLMLTDVALYLYVIERPLPGIGFDLSLRGSDLLTGLRQWALFAPIGIGLGLALGFLEFHARMPSAGSLAALVLMTFLFVAIPEEVFFRGLLQNLLQTRLSRRQALVLASAVFGLSHYVHGPVFNWRYVILAAIAGSFYGVAWLRAGRVGASAITHTLVDVVWITWFLNAAAM